MRILGSPSLWGSSQFWQERSALGRLTGNTVSGHYKWHYFCQAQFQLASSVPVQLRTEISLYIWYGSVIQPN